MLAIFTAQNIDLFTVGVAAAAIGIIGFVVFLSNTKSITNASLLFFSIATIGWVFSNFFQYKFNDIPTTLIALRINLFIAVWHSFTFFRLAYVFPRTSMVFPKWYTYVLLPVVVVTSLLTLTDLVFVDIQALALPGEVTNPTRGPGIIVFSIVTIGMLFLGLALLVRNAIRADASIKRHMYTVLVALTLTAIFILSFNVILPLFYNTLTFLPYTGLLMFPLVGILAYSIFKQRLFNLKVVVVEVFVFALATASFIDVLFSTNIYVLIVKVLTLILIVVVGILLTQSVTKEVEAKEQIQALVRTLELTNQKLKELDRLKSEFLSIASHDLRSPVTAIRNFISLVLDGTYGVIPVAAEDGLRKVFDRTNGLMTSIETYLNVSRIEQGKMKYDFVVTDFEKVVRDSVALYAPVAAQKKVQLSLTVAPDAARIPVNLDVPKMQEVLNNLIDNSIKYTPNGSIMLTLERVAGGGGAAVARLTMVDTGIGMSQATQVKLFRLFSTGDESRKVNPYSTGVGLYITRAHTMAHRGMISASSKGEGYGSTFTLELPVA